MKKIWFLIAGYLLVALGFFIYSFTQVDLSLTFSQSSVWQVVQRSLQYIGYFQRPLSTGIFIVFLFLFFGFYILFLKFAEKNKISRKQLWFLIFALTIILTFSYNAFSYDLFNYIFDAKIVTYYHQNPYDHKALDYAGDPMLSFMRWTHRTYPYGPSWIALTIPLSYLGFGYFIVTFFIFKIFIALCFLGTAYFVEKIVKKLYPGKEIVGLTFFVLNPLVIIESLVSGHHDITMMFFAMAAFYFFVTKRYVLWIIFFLLSVGIKFATLLLIPVFAFLFFQRKNNKQNIEFMLGISILCMAIAVFLSSYRTEIQPWYLIWVLPWVALFAKYQRLLYAAIFFSFCMLLTYIPFLYTGEWGSSIIVIKTILVCIGLGVGILLLSFRSFDKLQLKPRK